MPSEVGRLGVQAADTAGAHQPSALLSCEAVTRQYESVSGQRSLALDTTHFNLHHDEFVCVIGPSGCGKTTLLNLLAGFLQPSTGRVLFQGQEIRGPSPERGVVFQEYSLFGWLTVADNIEFGLRIAGLSARQRKTEAAFWLDVVGLSHVAGKYPFELSGGMRQRVAIARALAQKPGLLLMDEPFSALDALTRSSLQDQLLQVRALQGNSVFFITHNISEAIFLADRILVMAAHPGRVVRSVDVTLPRPRRRTDPGFNALILELESALGLVASE